MIVVTDPDPGFRGRVAGPLRSEQELIEIEEIAPLERLLAERAAAVSVVLLGPGLPAAEALRVASETQRHHPHVSFILVTGSFSSELLHAALRAGVRDVLQTSFGEQQLREVVERALGLAGQIRERTPGPAEAPVAGAGNKIITVFSSKGGSGKSFVSSNLAVLLAQRTGESVALVDLDLQFGDLAIMLQLFPARTIYEAAQELDRLDAEALAGYLTPYRSLVHLLAAPLEPGLAETISAEAAHRILVMLKQIFAYVVIDTPPSFTDHLLSALDETDELVLITTMDVPSIKNLKLSLQTLELLGFGRDRVKLILNRADSKVGLRVQDVEKTLGTRVDVSIPSSPQVPLSINQGSPLVSDDPSSPVAAAINHLADKLAVPAAALRQQAPQQPGSRFRLRRR